MYGDAMRQPATVWDSDSAGRIGGVPFRWVSSDYHLHKTTADEIVVLKPKGFFDAYKDWTPKRILEVGIFEGGSTLILADMFPEAEIIAIDIREANPAVQDHLERLGFADRVKLHYEVSQSDGRALKAILGDFKPDLVIDDASHVYRHSVATFNVVFPRVTPRGRYVIEDWGWAHWSNWVGHPIYLKGKALSTLVLELVMAAASRPDVIASVHVDSAMAVVTKANHKGKIGPLSDMVRLNDGRTWSGP